MPRSKDGGRVSMEPMKPSMKCWNYEINMSPPCCSCLNHYPLVEASEKLICTLLLPQGHQMQLQLKYFYQARDQRAYEPNKNGHHYQLVLDKSVGYSVKISVRVISNSSDYDMDRKLLTDAIDIKPGVPLPIASSYCYLTDQDQRRKASELKILLNVHFPMQSGDNNEVLSTGPVAHMRSHVEMSASLLSLGLFADCKVVSNDGNFYNCHKALLSLKSEVFRRAFEADDFVEAKTNQIQIDCDSRIADLILPYFYTGQMPEVTKKSALELYRVAHMYHIEGLRAFVAEEIMLKANQLVSISTVLEMVVFAENFDLKVFQQFCLKFISGNRQAVLNLPEWKAFRSAHLNLLDQLSLL